MALGIEQAQRLSDMRVRMLNNIKANLPPHHGFTKEEIKESLEMIRAGRGASAAAAATKAKKGGGKKKKAPVQVDTSTFFGGIDLDADDLGEDGGEGGEDLSKE